MSQELLAAVHRRAEALANRDADALRCLLHPKFRWTSHRGEHFDRDSYVASNTAGPLVWKRQSLHDVVVTIVGETGVVTAIVTDEVERDGVADTFRMPVTLAWVLIAGHWRCVAGHAGPRFP